MEFKTIELSRQDRIAVITLNRPHRLNAWTGRMHTEYRHLLRELDADPAVRVLVLTGAGRGFCAGADSQALEGHVQRGGYDAGTPDDLANPGFGVRPEFDADFAYHFGLSKPILAAVNGPAAGAGMCLACYCDLRFASDEALFTTAHARLGLPAEFGLSWLLPRIIGLSHANDLLLSSRRVGAREALAMGLVNAVFPADELMPRVLDYARMLAEGVSPASLRATRHQIYSDLHRDVGTSVRDAQERLEAMMRGADYREGVAALLEKRPPDFPPLGDDDPDSAPE